MFIRLLKMLLKLEQTNQPYRVFRRYDSCIAYCWCAQTCGLWLYSVAVLDALICSVSPARAALPWTPVTRHFPLIQYWHRESNGRAKVNDFSILCQSCRSVQTELAFSRDKTRSERHLEQTSERSNPHTCDLLNQHRWICKCRFPSTGLLG